MTGLTWSIYRPADQNEFIFHFLIDWSALALLWRWYWESYGDVYESIKRDSFRCSMVIWERKSQLLTQFSYFCTDMVSLKLVGWINESKTSVKLFLFTSAKLVFKLAIHVGNCTVLSMASIRMAQSSKAQSPSLMTPSRPFFRQLDLAVTFLVPFLLTWSQAWSTRVSFSIVTQPRKILRSPRRPIQGSISSGATHHGPRRRGQ